ncbi:hypothetical protein LUZ63_018270 [Rhynchospora breviuscula]|uniref:UDENN domain-containing protein n=1 Tax=Rhynchospora breviuscula TaxID=2022672 RepID=A0A9Q0HIF7_9POAL|nr:hypothetical protein LUZ63_018270 [Rhynchospora breviuscula]
MNGIGPNSDPASAPAAAQPDPTLLRRWVVAFFIIRFDLERGQVVEKSYPDPPPLPPDKLRLISFSSFPDSMSHHLPHHRSTLHDSLFSFRLPNSNSDQNSNKDPDYYYGFVFNRQRQDPRLPRGGEQKSVVILTHLPFSTVFRLLLQILGPLCFDLGDTALSLVASHVAAWPDPVRGAPMELPIGNASLRVHLPPNPESPPPVVQSNPSVPHGLFHDSDLFSSFRGVILHLWNLWEMMLIGEPILVIAPTPSQCSEAVSALVSLIAPIPCSVDYRPYFTIHDPEFAHLNSLPIGVAFPPLVLGVTNLFFLKALRNIPTVVSVGSQSANSTRALQVNGTKLDQLSKFSPSTFFNNIKMKREGPLSLMTEHKEAVWSKYTGCSKPDTAVLNRLVDAGVSSRVEESMSVVNNEILRRHFLELTTNFLAPFGPYFRVNTPIEGNSPFMDPPPASPFRSAEFLEGLATRGPGKFLAKRMRSNWMDLYRRFMEGRNFMPWFQRRRVAAEIEQQRLWRQARINVDIQKLISNMSELERLDLFNSVERYLLREIESYESGARGSVAACDKLKMDLQAVYCVLPKDTQELLVSNPKRASLLQPSATITDSTR